MNALLGLTAPRRLSAVRPQGTAPELKFAAACFVSLLLLLLIWLGRGGAVGKILMSIALLAIVAFLYRLFAKPKLDPVYGKILRARIPDAVWKDRMLRDFTLSDKQKAALDEALRDWLIIRRQCDAPVAQPSPYVEQLRLVASGWRASGAVHQSLYQPQRHAHLGICLRAAGRRAGQACFFAALVVCGSLAG